MPRNVPDPPSPPSTPEPEPETASIAESVRGAMLGIGELGIALGSDGSYSSFAYDGQSTDDSAPAKSWWGRILQWAWALLAFVIGLAVLVFFLLVGIGWVVDLFS